MPQNQEIRARLSLMLQYWPLVSLLYAHRDNGGLETPVHYLAPKNKEKASRNNLIVLQNNHIIDYVDGKWTLTESIIMAYDALNETPDDATPERIAGDHNKLTELVEQYMAENEHGQNTDETVKKIKRLSNQAIKNTSNVLDSILEEIRHGFSNQSNHKLKEVVLNQSKGNFEKLRLEVMGSESQGVTTSLYGFFENELGNIEEEGPLNDLSFIMSLKLNELWKEKSTRTHREIIKYLDRFNQQNELYQKIERFRKYYLEGTLEHNTNIADVDKEYYVQPFAPRKLCLAFEDIDTGIFDDIIASLDLETGKIVRASERLTVQRMMSKRIKPEILFDQKRNKAVKQIFTEYTKENPDIPLSDYVINHPSIEGFTLLQRISTFLEITKMFSGRLLTTSRWLEYADENTRIYCRETKLKQK